MPEPSSRGSHVASQASRSACAGQLDDLEPQAGAAERAAVGAQRRGRVAGAQLLLDVGDDAVVRGRGRAEHRDAVRQPLEHLGEPPVVGPEVVAPVGDAVRLVDHEQPDALGEQRQHRVAELRVVEPLGADQQQVDRVGARAAPATSSHASRLVELIVCARIPSRSAAAIWLRISASSGETISAGPAPCSRSSAVARK